jgi:hypothetical protein
VIKEWIRTWERSLQGLLNGEGPKCVVKNVLEWVEKNHFGLIPLPDDVIKKIEGAIGTVLSALYYKIEEMLKEYSELILDFVEEFSPEILNLAEKYCPEIFKAVKKAYQESGLAETVKELQENGLFRNYDKIEDLFEDLDNDFKEYGAEIYPYGVEGKEFRAFSLSLSAAKLCVVGHNNLNLYMSEDVFKESTATYSIKRLKIRIKTKSWSAIPLILAPGTSDVVRFDVYTTDGFSHTRTIIGHKFDAGKTVEKTIELPRRVDFEEIYGLKLSKKGNDDWDIDFIEVFDADRLVEADKEVDADKKADAYNDARIGYFKRDDIRLGEDGYVGVTKIKTIQTEIAISVSNNTKTRAPHKIMSWLYSLDGAGLTSKLLEGKPVPDNPAPYRSWEYKEYEIFRDIMFPRLFITPPATDKTKAALDVQDLWKKEMFDDPMSVYASQQSGGKRTKTKGDGDSAMDNAMDRETQFS